MVVDDDRLVLATLVAGLKQAGFDVIEADNGDDAILLARKHKPQLAILDMRMQGKSGMDVARYLAANTDTGFMFLSAFGDSDIVEEATRMGALGYLVKPLDVRQIVPAVRAALSRAGEMRGPAPVAPPADAPPAAPGRWRRCVCRRAPRTGMSPNWPRPWSTPRTGSTRSGARVTGMCDEDRGLHPTAWIPALV